MEATTSWIADVSVGGLRQAYLVRLAQAFERGTTSEPPSSRLVESLSERQLEVLRLLVAGKQNHEIADELYVTLNSVKKHVTHIFDKLGVVNRTQAAARARQLGIL